MTDKPETFISVYQKQPFKVLHPGLFRKTYEHNLLRDSFLVHLSVFGLLTDQYLWHIASRKRVSAKIGTF